MRIIKKDTDMELKSKASGINANGLKLIAIVVMTIDHVAWILLSLESAAAEVLHILGRLACKPIFTPNQKIHELLYVKVLRTGVTKVR